MHLVASSRELLLSSSFVRMMPAPIILFSVHGAASGQVFNCGEVSKVATLKPDCDKFTLQCLFVSRMWRETH